MADQFLQAVSRTTRVLEDVRMHRETIKEAQRKLVLLALIDYVEGEEVLDSKLATICNLAREVTR